MEWFSVASHYPPVIIPSATYVTGTFHPPAGINPLLVVSNGLPWSFLLAP
jgi:hypothetical protein